MQVDATVFTCISMLARAMGPSIQQDIKELLEPMLAVGLRYVQSSSTCSSVSHWMALLALNKIIVDSEGKEPVGIKVSCEDIAYTNRRRRFWRRAG